MTPREFVDKWRIVEVKERSAAQEHFIDLCHLIGHPTPADFDPTNQPLNVTLPPIQTQLTTSQATPITLQRDGYTWTLTPRAHYQIAARVLGNKTYRWDWESAVAPRDLALGWGDMSDPTVDQWLNWSQSNRWFYVNWPNDSPYKGSTVLTQAANTHIIPATDNLAKILSRIQTNQHILLEGYLVDITAQRSSGSPRTLQTSLTRTDSGSGACEILYVQRLIIDGQEYH